MPAAAGAAPAAPLPAVEDRPEQAADAASPSAAAEAVSEDASPPCSSVASSPPAHIPADHPAPASSPADGVASRAGGVAPQRDDELAEAIPADAAHAQTAELEQSKTERQTGAADADLATRPAEAGLPDDAPRAAAPHERGGFGSLVVLPDAVSPSQPDAAALGDEALATSRLGHSSSEDPSAPMGEGVASASGVQFPQSPAERALPAAAQSSDEVSSGAAHVPDSLDARAAAADQPPEAADVLMPALSRSITDEHNGVAADEHFSLQEVPGRPHARTSMDSYAGAASVAITSCSSDALTAELTDDEDRPRSGWPLMLRWRYGTPGPSPSEDGAPSYALDDGHDGFGSVQLPLAPPSMASLAAPVAELPPSAAGQRADQELIGWSVATEQQPAAASSAAGEPQVDGLAGDALLSGLTAAEQSGAQQDDGQSSAMEQAEARAAVADDGVFEPPAPPDLPVAASLVEAPAAAAPSAADVAPADRGAQAGVEDESSAQWHVLRAVKAVLPPAAAAARYQRSESSPAAANVPHVKVRAVVAHGRLRSQHVRHDA